MNARSHAATRPTTTPTKGRGYPIDSVGDTGFEAVIQYRSSVGPIVYPSRSKRLQDLSGNWIHEFVRFDVVSSSDIGRGVAESVAATSPATRFRQRSCGPSKNPAWWSSVLPAPLGGAPAFIPRARPMGEPRRSGPPRANMPATVGRLRGHRVTCTCGAAELNRWTCPQWVDVKDNTSPDHCPGPSPSSPPRPPHDPRLIERDRRG